MVYFTKKLAIIFAISTSLSCAGSAGGAENSFGDNESVSGLPLFANSVVSNDIDFITTSDPSTYKNLQFIGRSRQEMPGRDSDDIFQEDVYVFKMNFTDGSSVDIFADANLASETIAQQEAAHFAGQIGKLPSFMRKELSHVVLNIGDNTAFSEDLGHFIVVSTENMKTRRDNHDMEETIFHEAVHATLDAKYLDSTAWKDAQASDNNFITEYAAKNPNKEDLAETALFYYAYRYYPERLSENIKDTMEVGIPARIKFLDAVFNYQP